MGMRILVVAMVCGVAAGVWGKEEDKERQDEGVRRLRWPGGHLVVVSEGPGEAKSIGSYSIRVYGDNPEDPVGNFICGALDNRDGALEDVMVADVDEDDVGDILITFRCVGTGSYLSAVAYAFRSDKLELIGFEETLEKDVDVIRELRRSIADPTGRNKEKTADVGEGESGRKYEKTKRDD